MKICREERQIFLRKIKIRYNGKVPILSEIACLCKGAFLLLAETDLLNGKFCATDWTVHDIFISFANKKGHP